MVEVNSNEDLVVRTLIRYGEVSRDDVILDLRKLGVVDEQKGFPDRLSAVSFFHQLDSGYLRGTLLSLYEELLQPLELYRRTSPVPEVEGAVMLVDYDQETLSPILEEVVSEWVNPLLDDFFQIGLEAGGKTPKMEEVDLRQGLVYESNNGDVGPMDRITRLRQLVGVYTGSLNEFLGKNEGFVHIQAA